MFGIGPKAPPPRQKTPWLDLIERAREEAPYAVEVNLNEQQVKKFRQTLDRSEAILDVSYRKGMLTIRYIGQRRRET